MMNRKEKIKLIKNIDFFNGLNEEDIFSVVDKITELKLEKKKFLFHEGDEGNKMYILIKGKIVLIKEKEANKQNVIAVISPVQYIGEMAILDNRSRSLSAKSVADCEFLILEQNDLNELIKEKPSIAFQIFKVLSERLRVATAKAYNY